MTSLILGSSGQIGSELTRTLKLSNQKFFEFDIKRDKNEDLRIPKNPILESHLTKADFVFFLAFDVGGSKYLELFQKKPEFISNNLRLMEYTFTALKKSGKPFIFASTQMSNMSHSPYGVLKAIGEAYTRSLNGLIVKFWNTYGVEEEEDKAHVITDFLRAAAHEKKIPMRTDGMEERQFLHAEDCTHCLVTLRDHYHRIPRDKELHITSFEWRRILDVAEIIANIFPGTKITPAKTSDKVQQGLKNEPDNSILTYWKPKITLEEGIKKVADLTCLLKK
jgi:nucleoside-diphosphate-sugar epimerase